MFMPDRASACALLAFRAAHGRHRKAKLLSLWSTGRDVDEADGAYLRHLRNQAGPSWLRQLTPRRWRAIERLAAPGDPVLAAVFLDRADRKSVVSGKSGSVRVDLGGSRIIKKKIK